MPKFKILSFRKKVNTGTGEIHRTSFIQKAKILKGKYQERVEKTRVRNLSRDKVRHMKEHDRYQVDSERLGMKIRTLNQKQLFRQAKAARPKSIARRAGGGILKGIGGMLADYLLPKDSPAPRRYSRKPRRRRYR